MSKNKGVKLKNEDVIRIGKKLFKVIRIELDSRKSKATFLKRARKKSEIGLPKSLPSKLDNSETRRFNPNLRNNLIGSNLDNRKPNCEILDQISDKQNGNKKKLNMQKEQTMETELARKRMLRGLENSNMNTSNINNTEGGIMQMGANEREYLSQVHPKVFVEGIQRWGIFNLKLRSLGFYWNL